MTTRPVCEVCTSATHDLHACIASALRRARAHAAHHWLVSIDDEMVWRQAHASVWRPDAHATRRPLEGVLVAIKDQFDVAGEVTTCGTGFYARGATRDAEAVALLRAAGAITFGKASMHELALGPTGRNIHHGDAANPWDATRDTGGSSSGAAALVAAGVVPLALGTDLGGSVRIPASFCGVPALKPTFGAISTRGLVPVAPTLEHVGLLGRDVELVRRAFRILAPGGSASARRPRDLRIGICDAWWAHAGSDTRRVARAAVDRLCTEGHIELRTIALPSLEQVVRIGALVSSIEASKSWGWALERPEATRGSRALGAVVRVALAVGREVAESEIERAGRARAALAFELERAFDDVDVIACPTTDASAARYPPDGVRGELDEDMVMSRIAFTMPFNLTGSPAVQVPCGFDVTGMPIGLQLAGPRGAELTLLELARLVEAATERKIPRLSTASRVLA